LTIMSGARARRNRRHAARPADPGLLGRQQVLDSLAARIEQARSGSGAFVLLVGEPGIGKSALAEAVAAQARARGFEVLAGRGHESAGAPAYWIWVQALRGWLDARERPLAATGSGAEAAVVAELLPELRGALPDSAAPGALDAEAARFRLCDAVSRLLLRSAAERPLLVLLDDLHWADPSSLELLRHLAGALERAPLLVVATCRDGEVAQGSPRAEALAAAARHAQVIPLGGLETEAVGRLAETVAKGTVSHAVAEALQRRTGGNPLFVLEVVRLLAGGGGDAALTARAVASAAPTAGVRHAVGRRLDRVSDGARALLEAAAVIGSRFPLDLLAGLAPGDGSVAPVAALLDEAVGAGLVQPVAGASHQLRFAHDLVREVLYAGIEETARTRLHLELAELLEMRGAGDERLAELAHHYFEARAAGAAAPAALYQRRAGDRALAQWACAEAAEHYRRALEAQGSERRSSDDERCELLLRIASALRQSAHNEARQACREAARLARDRSDGERLARAALLYPVEASELSLTGGFDPELAALLAEALAQLGGGHPLLRVQLRARLAPARADRLAWSQATVRDARELADADTLATSLTALLWSLPGPESAPERLSIARELIELGEREQRPLILLSGLHAEVPALLELGERTEADLAVDRLDAQAAQLALPRLRMTATIPRALQAFLDGDLAASEARAKEVLALGRAAGSSDAPVAFGALLLAIRAEQRRLGEMEPALRAMAAGGRVPVARFALCCAWAEQGRDAEAREQLDRLVADRALPRDAAWPIAMHFASEAAVQLRAAGAAAAIRAALLPCAERSLVFTGTSCFGSAARHLGALAALLGDDAEAEAHFERGLALDARMRAVPWLTWGQIGLAGVLARRGDAAGRERADALLSAARAAAQRFALARALAACDRVGSQP
jgi:hypothetical protein